MASPDSPRVVLFRLAATNPSTINVEIFFKLNLMIYNIMVEEDDQFVICGLILFQDLTALSMGHMAHMNPATIKKSMTYFQQAHPTRPKEIHFFNIPSFFDGLLGIIKPFMKEKVQQRVGKLFFSTFPFKFNDFADSRS